jgi:hypothetical protein
MCSTLGYALGLAVSIVLGWNDSPGTDTLAYLLFITLTPGPNVIKLFTSVIYEFSK